MTDEEKQSLSPEQRLEFIKPQLDIYVSSVSDKAGSLTSISSLAAMLLVIATFNPNLVPLNDLVRTLLSILLIMIPVSMGVYIHNKNKAAIAAMNIAQSYIGKNPTEEIYVSLIDRVIAIFPEILNGILALTIVVLLIIIWVHATTK